MDSSETVTTFDDIPQEILVSKIFSRLTPQERQQLRKVSTKWQRTVDKFFGHRVHITNNNWDSLSASSDLVHCKFTNWTRDLQLTLSPTDFCSRIKTLEIFSPSSPICYYNILPLLKQCVNIHTLVLGNIVGAFIKDFEKDVDYSLDQWLQQQKQEEEAEEDGIVKPVGTEEWFPLLENFKFVDDFKTKSKSLGSYAQGCCHRKDEFLKFIFSKLSQTKLKFLEVQLNNSFWWMNLSDLFKLEDKVSEDEEEELAFENERKYKTFVQIPLKLLGSRRVALESVKLHYHNFIGIECKFHKKNFSISGIRQLETFKSSIRRKMISGRTMTTSRLVLMQGQEIHTLWSEVLQTQFTLREFDAQLTFDSADHLLPILRNNAGTLQHTRIVTTAGESDDEEDRLWENFDFRRFQRQRETLTHLSFLIDHEQSPQNQNPEEPTPSRVYIHPIFQQIKSLPSSLVQLEISCPLDLTSGENDTTILSNAFNCLKHLRNLRVLELWNRIGEEDSSTTPAWFVVDSTSITKLSRVHIESILRNLHQLQTLKFQLNKKPKDCCRCKSCDCCASESDAWRKLRINDNFEEDVMEIRSVSVNLNPQEKITKEVKVVAEIDTEEGRPMRLKCLSVNIK